MMTDTIEQQGKKQDKQIAQIKKWVETVIIELNLCPFAKREFDNETIDYQLINEDDLESQLQALIKACSRLDNHYDIETSLLIFPKGLADFDDYLDFLELANQLMEKMDYEGVFQLASFHPDYQFEGTDYDDASNFSNRSPYPVLHLLRESSLEKALAAFPDPENIPKRNINKLRELGYDKMLAKLEDTFNI